MGRKTLFFLSSAYLILFSISSLNCKKKEKQPESPLPLAQVIGDLNVLHVSPKGATLTPRESEEIVVIFDKPMAILQALPQEETLSLLKLEPPFAGKYRWMGTKTLTFTPSAQLPYATDVKVAIPAGTKSLNGYSLKKDHTWSFQTIRPRLINHFPQDGEKQLKLETQILLIFNQPVDKDRVKEFISFMGIDKEKRETSLNFMFSYPSAKKLEELEIQASPDQTLLLELGELLKPDFVYSVELRSGLLGREGSLGMEENKFFSFETFKTFKFESMGTGEGQLPTEPLYFNFSNRVIYKEFVKMLRFEPEVEIPEYYSEWDYGSNELWLSLPLEPEREYTCSIDGELKDEFGNKLEKEVKIPFKTLSSPPFVSMTSGHGIVEAYGSLFYPVNVLNVQDVFFQGARISKEEVIPLLASEKVFWMSEKFIPKRGFQVEKRMTFEVSRNKTQIVPLPLKEIIPDENHGLVFIQLDTFSPEKWRRYLKALLQITEIGISGKFSPENNIIWVTELKTGLPLPEVEVEIRDGSNNIRWKGRTDKDGKAETPGWKILGIKSKDEWSKPEQWVFARRGKDTAFTSSEWGTGIDPYRFEIEYDWNPQPPRIQGYVFTERGIYRAGELVHIKGIIRKREKGNWILPSAKEIECEVHDPFQKIVHKGKIPLDSYGSFALDLETREDASLGYYQIMAKVPPEKAGEKVENIYGSFSLEAFRAAEFEVLLRTLRESFIFGDEYKAEVRGNYLFGGAMSGQKTTWSLRLNRTYFAPQGHKGFTFGNELDEWWEEEPQERSRLLASGEGVLNEEGKVEIKVPLKPEKEKATVEATLEATVQSPSRRSISNRIRTFVHQGEFYIGLRPSSSFIKKGDAISIQVIATNPEGSIIPEKKLAVKLIKREWRSVKKGEIGGRFKWISEKEDTEIASRQIETKNEPVEVSFQPEKSGLYFISSEGLDTRKNRITTTTYLYVTGEDYVPWERRDDDTLELVADSEKYKPGETAKILVKSPYEQAKALITIEREFILKTWITEIRGSSTQIEIPIISDFIPNVFISVLLVQGRTAKAEEAREEDLGKPSFKIGYVKLSLDPSERRLSVDISSDKNSYKPRDKVTLKIKVEDLKNSGVQSSIALAVVDVGVLNLIGYKTPNPFDLFYGEKPLSVQTSETRLHVVGQRAYGEKGESAGGGGAMEEAPAVSLAEFELRGDFKSTAYWNPSVLTDNKGEATVEFNLPDNLTTFRVMAVAQTRDSQFGQNELSFKVSKPLLLLPSLPRFARLGDKFQAGVVVNNYSSRKGEVTLYAEATGILLLDKKTTQQFSLDPGQGKEVLFTFEAEKPGKAKFAFRAKMGEETDGLEIILPIQFTRPLETVALFDQTQESREEKILVPENIYLEESKIEVQAAASAISDLKGSVDYLTDYPYLCLEQRLSSILPYLVAPQIIQDFKLSSLDRNEIRKKVQATIIEIWGYAKDNGGFGLWPDSSIESPFISCYAVYALVKAKAEGYEVEEKRLGNAVSYLRNLFRIKFDQENFPYSSSCWKTIQAFALYDLALLGHPEASYAEKLFGERNDLSLFGKALLLKALHSGFGSVSAQNTLLQELMNKIKVTAEHAHFEDEEDESLSWIYSSNVRTTAFILQAMMEIGSDHPLLPSLARWLVEKRKAGCWHSTQENFYVFYALNDFYAKYEKVKADFKVKISLEKKLLLEEILKARSALVTASSLLTEFKPGKALSLQIQKKGDGILYYGARLTYAPKAKLEARDEGLAIYKKFEALDGKPLASIKAGSLVVVTLQVIVTKESLFVVVNDPLAAGFEAVNPRFLTESEEEQQRLEAQGRKRPFRWWEGFNHMEMHDNRVLLFADSLGPGIHTHRYLVRALNPGVFLVPGTKVEEMYSPEIFGRSAEQIIRIVK